MRDMCVVVCWYGLTLGVWCIVGVFNALEGCDGEIEIKAGLTEANMGQVR
jgi:hypothetical protein